MIVYDLKTLLKAESSDWHRLGKSIAEEIGKASISITI